MTLQTDRKLTPEEIHTRLTEALPGWRFQGDAITRSWHTENWKGTLMLATTIGHLAEVAWHHPELVLNYARVEVRLNTHSAVGVTEKDIALAKKIDAVLGWHPSTEGILEGTPDVPEHRYLKP